MPDETTVTATDTAPVTTTTETPMATAPAAPPANETAQAATTAQPAETPATAQAAAPAEVPAVNAEKDEIAASLAALNREIRAAKAEREKYKGQSAHLADKVAAGDMSAKAIAAIQGKDYLTALRTLDPNLSVDDAILTLLEQARALDAQPMSQADIERVVAAKLEADRKATEEAARLEAEKTTKAQAEALELAERNYLAGCGIEQQSGAFPLVNANSTSPEQVEALEKMIKKHVAEVYAKTRAAPSPRQSLEMLEAFFEANLKAAGYTKAQIAEAKADAAAGKAEDKKPVATAPVADTRGTVSDAKEKPKFETMAEYDKRVKAQLRALKGTRPSA